MLRKAIIAVLLILVFSTLAMAEVEYKVQYSSEITDDVRRPVEVLESRIFESLLKNDPTVMYNLYSAEAKEEQSLDDVKGVYETVRGEVQNLTSQRFNDYYITFNTEDKTVYPTDLTNVSIPPAQSENYLIALKLEPKPSYISLYRTTTGMADYMISFLWVKEDSGWRLQWFNVGLYQLMGKSGHDWYLTAKQWAEQGCDAPAMMNLSVSTMLMNPAPFFSYQEQFNAMSLVNTVQSNLLERVSFPLLFPQVKTKPQVYNIEPQLLRDGLYPGIQYVTKISLNDAAGLRKEAETLVQELEAVFPGITRMASHVVFHAFAEPPTNPAKQYQAHTLTVEVKK